jgi:hypothetical protein
MGALLAFFLDFFQTDLNLKNRFSTQIKNMGEAHMSAYFLP